jgi:hypothetical protein
MDSLNIEEHFSGKETNNLQRKEHGCGNNNEESLRSGW